MNFTFTGAFLGRPVSGAVADDVLDAPVDFVDQVRLMIEYGIRVSWANMGGRATLDGWMGPATIDYALDRGTARFDGLPKMGPELPHLEGELAEAWGDTKARAQAAVKQNRVGGGHDTGGQFSKRAVPAIGSGVGVGDDRAAVGTPGETEAHTLFRPDGKTIFGHSIPPGVREATPEERKAARIPPGYPLGYVPEDGKPLPDSGVMGWGVDKQGRVKRFYTPEKTAERQKKKFERIRVLDSKMDGLDRDLVKDADEDDRAACAMLVRATGMRPGSTTKTGGAKQAYGATTLQAQHVSVDDDLVSFDFIGKNGKQVQFEVHNLLLAQTLGSRLEGKAPDEDLFPGVTDTTLNAYLKETLGGSEFKTKDLRTYLATATAQARVSELTEIPEGKAARQKLRKQIATEISERLGNTPTEVINSYVDPQVWATLGL